MKDKQKILEAKIQRLRYSGTHGTVIHKHRSLRKLKLTLPTILAIILLPILFDTILWMNLDKITGLWDKIFQFWIEKLYLPANIYFINVNLPGKVAHITFTDLPMSKPSQIAIWLNILFSIIAWYLLKPLPQKYMPLLYILRAILAIQISASVYFIFSESKTLYDLNSYMGGMITLGIYTLFIIAPFLALIYYIFDFPLWHKLLATTIMIAYFIVVLPFQYLLHAFVISSGSLLFMPTLYIFFGLLLNTLMFIGCFSWIMTWGKGDNV